MTGRIDQTLHEVLRQMPYGLHVLGVRGDDGQMNACVVSWVMQCSFFPPLLLVAIRKPSRTYDLISRGNSFTLNLINKEDERLVRHLVKPADMVGDKLDEVAYSEHDTGAPVLERAFAYIECTVREVVEPGDHALVIGDIVHAEFQGKGEPLTCADLGWHYGG